MARTQIKTPGLANDAVTAAQIAAGAVGTSEIANDAVTAAKIAAGAVGSTEIAANAVTATQIATGAVGSTEIAANAVTATQIAAGAVGSTEIANSSVTADKIAAGVLSGNFPANWSIPGYQKLPNGFTIQWGTTGGLGQQSQFQAFAIPFTGGVFSVQVTPNGGGGNAGDKRDHWVASNWTLGGFTLTSWFENGAASYSWVAFGV